MAATHYKQIVKTVRDYLAFERKSQQEADEWAFRIGKIFWWEILGGRSHVRDQGALLSKFAKDIGKAPASVNKYKLLYLGARSLKNIKRFPLRREQFERIGRYLPDEYEISYILRNSFYHFAKTDIDDEQLEKALMLAKETVEKTTWISPLQDLEPFKQELVTESEAERTFELNETDLDKFVTAEKQLIALEEEIWKRTRRRLPGTTLRIPDQPPLKAQKPTEFAVEQTPEAMERERRREHRIERIKHEAGDAAKRRTEERVFCGKAEHVLKDPKRFPQRSISIVATDPPYGTEFYKPWREYTKVEHDSPPSALACAELVGKVADIILSRKINQKSFAWYSFCPLNAVDVFLPPLRKVFQKHYKKFTFNVLVWNKHLPPKAGGDEHFSLDAEAILYFSVDRPLATTTFEGKRTHLQRRIICEQPVAGFWKPPRLMAKLIHLSTHSEAEVVLDPFAGKGSTGLGAMLAHREFRLIESHKGQFDEARANVLDFIKAAGKNKRRR